MSKLRMAKHEVKRASFQMADAEIWVLYQEFNEAGTITWLATNFRGHVLDERVNPTGASFEGWMHGDIGDRLKAVVS